MGFAGTNLTFQEYWESTDTGRVAYINEEFLRDYIQEVTYEQSAIYAAIGKSAGEFGTLAPRFQTREGYPRKLLGRVTGSDPYAITFSGSVMHGTTLTTNLLQQFVVKNTILQKEVDGEIYEIKLSEDPTSLSVVCAASGGTSMVVDDAPIWWDIVATPWSDKTDFKTPSAVPRRQEHTFTQIFEAHLQITQTDKNLREQLVTDPFEDQFKLKMNGMADEKARAVIRMSPVTEDGGTTWLTGYDTDEPQMAGLNWWMRYAQTRFANPYIDLDAGGEPLNGKMLKNVMHSLVNDELSPQGTAGYIVVGNATTMRYVETFEEEYLHITKSDDVIGRNISGILLNGEETPFATDNNVPESHVYILPAAQIELGHFRGGAAQRKKIETAGMYDQWTVYEHIVGLIPKNPRWIGRVKNVKSFSLSA
jgi:hypothetical protein